MHSKQNCMGPVNTSPASFYPSVGVTDIIDIAEAGMNNKYEYISLSLMLFLTFHRNTDEIQGN